MDSRAVQALNHGLRLACLWIVLTLPSAWGETVQGTVIRVIDGDSIVLRTRSAGDLEVRLLGIDAPEHDQPYGAAAKAILTQLVQAKDLNLSAAGIDRYGRTLGCPQLSAGDLCEHLVRVGSAWVYTGRSNDPTLLTAQALAQAEKIGLWALPPEQVVPPWEWRHRPQQTAATQACPIKGNINASGARIYHVPGQRHYLQTGISAAKGERWFCTEAQAQAAGWRKARR